MGDSSDNIPGVPGIGEKTAFELIKKYETIDKLYENIDNNTDDVKGKTREKLIDNKELAYLSKELGTIDIDAPIEKNLADIKLEEYDNEKLLEIFNELKFNRFIEKLNLNMANIESKSTIEIPEIIVGVPSQGTLLGKELYYYLDENSIGSIYNPIDNKIYVINDFLKNFKEIFEDKTILKIGYKLKQDFLILKQNNINPENMMFDIEIAAYILNSSKDKYTLEELAKDYLDIDVSIQKQESVQLDLFSDVSADTSVSSQEKDKTLGLYAFCIFKLHNILINKLKETNQLDLFNNIEMPLLEVLADMEYTGIHIDKQALISYGEELKQQIDTLTKEIYNLSGEEFNINSPKQLGEILFEKLQLPSSKKTKTGYSTDVDVLEKLKTEHPVIEKLLEYRQLSKLNSTYVEGMIPHIKEDNRIHSVFHQTVTTTGRISSTEPNLQNIPIKLELGKRLRKVFTAKEGNILLDADYSQIELRVLAHIANDENMVQAFKNDEDIHSQAASKVFNVPLEEVTKELRSQAKAVNFGIVYGISDFGLAGQLSIPKKKAKEYIDQYLEKYIGIKQFMDDIIEKVKEARLCRNII